MNSFVKREDGVLKPIPEKSKMYIAFQVPNNPNCDPNGLNHDFREGRFAGMSGSEDLLRQSLKDEVSASPDLVFAIFEVVRLIKAEAKTTYKIEDRNMR